MTSELHRSLAYTSIYTGSTAEAAEHAVAAVAAAEPRRTRGGSRTHWASRPSSP